MSFLLILVGFLEKGGISKIWENFGVLRHGIGPRQGVACPHRSVTERRLGQASSSPRRSNTMPRRSIVHSMEIFGVLFCFIFLLL